MSDWSVQAGNSVGFVDRAETFAESGVTVGHGETVTTNEGIELASPETATIGDGSTQSESSGEYGVLVDVTQDLDRVEFTTSPLTSGYDEFRIRDQSDGTLLDSKAAGGGGGETVAFDNPGMTAGNTYRLVVHDSGSWTNTFSGGIPVSTAWGDVTDGYFDGSLSSNAAALTSVTGYYNLTSSSVTVEWSQPPDVFAWDTATFQENPDGETVEVFVEESTDGGNTWTEVAGPLRRGDDIPASPSSEVRFRVDLTRADITNRPRIEALYRRYTV